MLQCRESFQLQSSDVQLPDSHVALAVTARKRICALDSLLRPLVADPPNLRFFDPILSMQPRFVVFLILMVAAKKQNTLFLVQDVWAGM